MHVCVLCCDCTRLCHLYHLNWLLSLLPLVSCEVHGAQLHMGKCLSLLSLSLLLQGLFADSRWDELVKQFREENFRLHQLNNTSVFTAALQAGLSSLKTPYPCVMMTFPSNFTDDMWGGLEIIICDVLFVTLNLKKLSNQPKVYIIIYHLFCLSHAAPFRSD